MIAVIRNVGRTRSFPTCIGNVQIPRLSEVRIADRKAAAEIMVNPNLLIDWEEGARGDPLLKRKKTPRIDYSKYRISELRSIAASMKVPGFFTMRKVDLIKILTTEDNKNE